MTYRLTQSAQDDVREIARYYATKKKGLGMRFAIALEECCCDIARNPSMGRPLSVRTRRWLLDVFPYIVLYRVRTTEVLIVRIVHEKRDPEGWRAEL